MLVITGRGVSTGQEGLGPTACALFRGESVAPRAGAGHCTATPSSLLCRLWVFPRSLGLHIPFC